MVNAIDVGSLINTCSSNAAYTTINSTSDVSTGSCWNTGGGGNVWFDFVATTTEIHVDINTGGVEGSARYIYGALWESDGTTQLACQLYFDGPTNDIELDAAGLTIGLTYLISVDNHNGSGGGYEGTFTLCLSDAVEYDLYEGAELLSDLSSWCSADAAFTTINATADLNTGSCWNTAVNSNRWFQFVATTTAIKVDIKTGASEGTARYMYASLWDTNGTTELACAEYFSSPTDDLELSAVGLSIGTTYYISVDNHNGSGGGYKGTFTLCIDDAVDYDFLEGAVLLTDLNSWCSSDAAYTTIGATADRNAGACWNTSVNSNRWFQFVATTTAIKVDIKTGSSEGTARYMYASLWETNGTTELACAEYFSSPTDDLELSAVGLSIGNTYYISVDNHNGSGGGYKGTFSLCIDDAVDYDFYEGATVLSNLNNWCSTEAIYTTINATADRNAGACWNTAVNSNRWFQFVATTTAIKVDIKTGSSEGTARYMYASLWETNGTTELACAEYFSSPTDDLELSAVGLSIGTTYYISVDNHNGSGGGYKGTFSLCIDDAVGYDFYEGAVLLADLTNWCSSDAAYTTIGATADLNAGVCWNTAVNSNRWFKFVATTAEVSVEIKTGSSEGSSRYMYSSLWESNGTTEVTCTEYFTSPTDDLEMSATSLTIGNTYYISVDNHNGSGGGYKGTFTLCVNDKVTYDFYEKAHEITNLNAWCSVNAEFTTVDATSDLNAGTCWNTAVFSNRWFKFTAISPTVTINVNTGAAEGSARYMYAALWESNGTTELDCDKYTSGPTDDLTLTYGSLTAGNTYYISVDNHNGSGGGYRGTFTLCVDNTDERYYSIASGAWNNGSNWSFTSGGGAAGDYPQVGDVANIENEDITLSTAATIAEININVGTAAASLTVDGVNLNVQGQFNFTNTGNNFNGSVSVINSGSISILDDLIAQRDGGANSFDFLVDNGSVSVNKSFTWDINGGSTVNSTMTVNNASAISVTEDFTLDHSGGTKLIVQFNNTSTLSVLQNIEFIAGANDLTEIELNNSSQINIGGNFVRGTPAYGILDCNSTSTVNYNSTTNLQTFAENAGGGTDGFTYQNVIVNNTRITAPQLTLDGPISIPGTLTLTDGVVSTTSTNLLTIAVGASISGGSAASHIDGPLKKVGNGDFEFPVGDNNIWQPISIANLTGDAATEFTAEYFEQTPSDKENLKSPDPIADLYNISWFEYWDLANTGTASDADITLFWKDQSRSDIDNSADLQIAHYTGAEWENLGQSSISFTDPGSISVTGLSSFSPFTFGSLSLANNPLPVELVSFESISQLQSIEINWITATELNNDFFELQKSTDGESFQSISRIDGMGTSNKMNRYFYLDRSPFLGIQYYRLKQVDFDGTYEYSEIISSYYEGPIALKIYPNPLKGNVLNIDFTSIQEEIVEARITSVSGTTTSNIHPREIGPGSWIIDILVQPGIYILTIRMGNTLFNERIIKQ